VNSTFTLTPNSDSAAFGIILCQDGCVAFAYEIIVYPKILVSFKTLKKLDYFFYYEEIATTQSIFVNFVLLVECVAK